MTPRVALFSWEAIKGRILLLIILGRQEIFWLMVAICVRGQVELQTIFCFISLSIFGFVQRLSSLG